MHRLILGFTLSLVVGCQHTHLRHNTVSQSRTLSDIYEQQVLDNLARTVHDAHAIPFFAYPKDGTTSINDQLNFSASPLRNIEHVLGVTGGRSGLEQWGLTPVSDPDKLLLMKCAYQRAVYGAPLDGCDECCVKEKAFEGKPDVVRTVFNMKTGVAVCNPKTGQPYNVYDGVSGLEYLDENGDIHSVDASGKVTIQKHDCNGTCGTTCGWLKYGKRCDMPKDCCNLVGFHCGTYVWVDKCHRQHLTRLTLKILDYAVNDTPTRAGLKKTVKLNIDRFGNITDKLSEKAGTVTAEIAIGDQIRTLITTDRCTLAAHRAAIAAQANNTHSRYEQGLSELSVEEQTICKDCLKNSVPYSLIESAERSKLSGAAKKILQLADDEAELLQRLESLPQNDDLSLPPQPEATPLFYETPRTIEYENQRDIQRGLRAIDPN